jgi:radical SAM superfamily enzyme YgiQ (UPF0313 family)
MNSWEIISQVRARVNAEIGTNRSQAPLRVALCYPGPYPVGMSSLGFQTIYREINRHEGAAAERSFVPDSPDEHRKLRLPVFTCESETPLADFPIIAFSISYELEIAGLFELLDLCGIPVLREERTAKHPLIVAGGPLTYANPLPLAPFVDLIILGEAEELIHAFLNAAASMGREELLRHFAAHYGCYVPGQTPALPRIGKAADALLPAHSQIITREAVLSSMFMIEPERGCSHACTYCVMRRSTNGGMRPVPPDKVMSLIPEYARRVGLVGAAVTDHPAIRSIVRDIVASGREIGVSSLRADRLDQELIELLRRGGYRTLTVASDGVSQRLRDAVRRQTGEKHLIAAAELVRKFQLERLKLYEMIGLPGETLEDIDELARFSLELARIAPLALAISPFVAKRNTPLDRSPFEPIPSLDTKLAHLRAAVKKKVEIRPVSARWAWVEYMLSQGGEDAGHAALEAWRTGGSFAAWKRALSKYPDRQQGTRHHATPS